MPKIVGANEPIRDIKLGDTQITDVYQGSSLLWRGFHVRVGECYNGNYILPLVYGPGTTMTVPNEFTGGTPPDHVMDGFIMHGTYLDVGHTYTFEEDPSNMTVTNHYGGSVPYSYKYKLQPNYVYVDPDPEPTTVSVTLNVSGFDVNMNGRRVETGGQLIKTGTSGESYGYNLGEIYYQGGFTNAPSGLSIAGVTNLSGANTMTKWRPGITPSTGKPSVSPLYSKSQDMSGTYPSANGTVVNYYYVYKYKGYYFT